MANRERILLKDIFNFDELLSRPEYKGRRIKIRFNKSWIDYDFMKGYHDKDDDFIPWILSRGSDKKSRNNPRDIQFQFIEVEYHKWLFVGAYLILDRDSRVHTNGVKYASAQRLTEFDKYKERLILNWKNKGQSWFYTNRSTIDNEMEVELVSSQSYFDRNIDFPEFENLSRSYSDLKKHFNNPNWRNQLSFVYGVYVITDTKTGKLYVGSAYGQDGIYGRWSAYLKDGYDKEECEDNQYPNKELRELVNNKGFKYIQTNFQYTLLEIFSKNDIGKQKALDREKYWKQVLKTREHGYNEN